MLIIRTNKQLKKFVCGHGLYTEKRCVCPNCFTILKFYDYCKPTCPGCFEIVPPVNELAESGTTQRVAYHIGKLL